jgi:peptide/nickel transport system ATP-binding protein
MLASPDLLRVDGLSTLFETSSGLVRAVDDVSFGLKPGRRLGIVGESGSGKSTLARSIVDLLPASGIQRRGRILWRERDLRQMDPRARRAVRRREIAMVFQDPLASLNPTVRVGRNITEVLTRHMGLGKSEARARAIALLGQVGIPEPSARIGAYPHQLSGGMRQRACIALALASSPALLIGDEPTAALDVTVQRQVMDLLGRLSRDSGMAMILISHNFDVIAGTCDDVAVMYAGRIVEVGSVRDVLSQPRHPYTQALFKAIPRIDGPSNADLAVIPGQISSLVDTGPGCRFAPRCSYVQPDCLKTEPTLQYAADTDGGYACFHAPSVAVSLNTPGAVPVGPEGAGG